MAILAEKEQKLKDRKFQLESSIQELKNSILSEETGDTSKLIEAHSLDIQRLETQLQLTELALRNTQDKLREREELESSKEFKDKQKMQEKLYKQAENEAAGVFEKLSSFVTELENVFELVRQADNLIYELSEDKSKAHYGFKITSFPYSTMFHIQKYLNNELIEYKHKKSIIER